MPVIGTPTTGGDAEGYYASLADLNTRIGAENVAAYSNVSGNTQTVDSTRVQHVLDDSDRQIDEMLRANGYSTPVPTTSIDFDALTDIACDLAYCKLYEMRMPRADAPDAMGREMYFKRRNAMTRLKQLIMGGIDASSLSEDAGHPVNVD